MFITPRFDESFAVSGNRSANLDMPISPGQRSSADPNHLNRPPLSTLLSRRRLTFCLLQHEAVLDEPC